jgi:catechol 2,3-dioxygenase-like lactoylglutathione lyase family enzyme
MQLGLGDNHMERIIADLVHHFECGRLTRRQVVQALSLIAAGGTQPVNAAQSGGIRGNGIDHVSILVRDLQRSATFYQTVFGMAPVSEDKVNRILRLGQKRTIVSLRQEDPVGMVDHFAIAVESFNRDAVTKELGQRGLTPQENVQFGFHVKDPDGVNVQIV